MKTIPHGMHSRERALGSWNWWWNTRRALVLKDWPHILQASWSGTEFTGIHTWDFRARWEAQCRPQTMQTWSNLASWKIIFAYYDSTRSMCVPARFDTFLTNSQMNFSIHIVNNDPEMQTILKISNHYTDTLITVFINSSAYLSSLENGTAMV